MLRRLSPIEISEGALLADIAIVFQLLSLYLPFLDILFRILTPAIFAILVLRRGLYIGLMGVAVTLFATGVMTGFHIIVPMAFACGAGLYLGVAMRRRLPSLVIILAGTTLAAIGTYALVFALTFLAGIPINDLFVALHKSYALAVSAVDFLAGVVGLSTLWRNDIYPALDQAVSFAFTYGLAFYFAVLWTVLLPIVVVIYGLTNSLLRLLGYDVAPFPGRLVNRMAARARRHVARDVMRRRLFRRRTAT